MFGRGVARIRVQVVGFFTGDRVNDPHGAE